MDPYKILGVSRSASDDEIKKAYRNLSRRYHPDANLNNPNKDAIEEKFKQINIAYDQIMNERKGGAGYYNSGRGPGSSYGYRQAGFSDDSAFGGFSDAFRRNNESQQAGISPEIQAAVNYIRNGRYQEAMHALLEVPENERNGTWFYLASAASQGMGNMANAQSFISRAIQLEPNNPTFREFSERLNNINTGGWYETGRAAYGNPYGSSNSSWCADLICMNLMCFCCRC